MRVFIVGAWAGCLTALLPRVGEACWPWDPHVTLTVPADDAIHPANASILIAGQVLDAEDLEATVDGLAATVTTEPRSQALHYVAWGPAYRALALTLEPPVEPGQIVHVFGNLCPPQAEQEPGCAEFDLQFEAGPPTFDPPLMDPEFWYDVYDHGSVAMSHSSCPVAPARFSIDAWVDIDEQAPAPTYFEILRRPRDTPGQWATVDRRWRLEPDHEPGGLHLRYLLDEVIGWLPLADAFCFELRTEDLAGNAGPTIERCPPCHDQIGEQESGFISDFPDGPPRYSDEWIHPDGYCPSSVLGDGTTGDTGEPATTDETGTGAPMATSTTGAAPTSDGTAGVPADDPRPGSGCGCVTGSTPHSPFRAAPLVLLILGAIRRR
ncbi:MAG: hypothetical protein AAGF11_10745 [Myxococcota bacterium]